MPHPADNGPKIRELYLSWDHGPHYALLKLYHGSLISGPLPKEGLGTVPALSRTFDADLRMTTCICGAES